MEKLHPNRGFDILNDEDGAAMVEFVIVLPFLALILGLVLYFTQLTLFQANAHQLAAVQTWQAAARESRTDDRSDLYSHQNPGIFDSIPIIGKPSSPQHIGMNIIQDISTIIDGDDLLGDFSSWGRATHLFAMRPSRWEVLGLNPYNYIQESLNPVNVGAGSDIRFRNRSYIIPVAGAASSFVGREPSGDTQHRLSPDDLEVSVGSRLPLMYDSFSIFWGDTANDPNFNAGGIQRLRNVDRYTILNDALYASGFYVHATMTGNPLATIHMFSPGLIPRDTNFLGAFAAPPVESGHNFDLNPSSYTSGLVGRLVGRLIGGISSLINQATGVVDLKHGQPLWKVDKGADLKNHDEDGWVRYDFPNGPGSGNDWGQHRITEKHRIYRGELQSFDQGRVIQ